MATNEQRERVNRAIDLLEDADRALGGDEPIDPAELPGALREQLEGAILNVTMRAFAEPPRNSA